MSEFRNEFSVLWHCETILKPWDAIFSFHICNQQMQHEDVSIEMDRSFWMLVVNGLKWRDIHIEWGSSVVFDSFKKIKLPFTVSVYLEWQFPYEQRMFVRVSLKWINVTNYYYFFQKWKVLPKNKMWIIFKASQANSHSTMPPHFLTLYILNVS